MGERDLPILSRWDVGADSSSLHMSKIGTAVPCGTVAIKAYEGQVAQQPVVECKIKVGTFEGLHKFLVHTDSTVAMLTCCGIYVPIGFA